MAAVQIFNNPNTTFKSETFVVLMVIAWTYLLHAYYKTHSVEYRYCKVVGKRRRFIRTKSGAFRHWDFSECLSSKDCPLDPIVVLNLRFILGLRDEIEHRMTTQIDDLLSARFQACCINYHEVMDSLFGEKWGIAHDLSVSLQFSSLTEEQVDQLSNQEYLPANIKTFIEGFDSQLTPEQYSSSKFAYRVFFLPKTINNPNQADKVVTVVKEGSELAKSVNATIAVVKEKEKPKWRPTRIVSKMQSEGFKEFTITTHYHLWKELDAKKEGKGFGVQVEGVWYWYDSWVDEVRKYCQEKEPKFKT